MSIFYFLDKKLQALYAPANKAEDIKTRKTHFYSLLFCFLLHTLAFFSIEESRKEVYRLSLTSIIISIVVILTMAKKNIFYVTITPVLTFMSEKYLFFSIAGTWITRSIILLMTQNRKLTLISLGVLAVVFKYHYKIILLSKISKSSIQAIKEYLDSQSDLLALTGFLFFLSILNFNSLFQSKNKVLIRTQNTLQAALEQQEVLIDSCLHELRTPINSLIESLELAVQEAKGMNVLKTLKTTQIYGDILLQLTDNILDVAKAGIGVLEVNLVPTNFRETLKRIWAVTCGMIKRKSANGSLTGSLIVSKNIPFSILIDQHRITQILLNLLSNSVKFTENGLIQVRVYWLEGETLSESCFEPVPYMDDGIFEKSLILEDNLRQNYTQRISLDGEFERLDSRPQVSAVDAKPGILKMVVMDTGCGISNDRLKKLFEKYSQVHEDPSKRKIGTGLSLWLIKQICKKMKGEIRAYSLEHVGTAFVVCIPCGVPGNSTRGVSLDIDRGLKLSADRIPRSDDKPIKALYVDDNTDNIIFNKRLLERAGVDVVSIASSGVSAAAR